MYTDTISKCWLKTVQMTAVFSPAESLWPIQWLSCPAKPSFGVKILFLVVRVISAFSLLVGKDFLDLILHLLGCETAKPLLRVALWGHQRPMWRRSHKGGGKHFPWAARENVRDTGTRESMSLLGQGAKDYLCGFGINDWCQETCGESGWHWGSALVKK